MWNENDFPGAAHVPWQLLIRARYQHEIDLYVASAVVRAVGAFASADVAAKVADVAAQVGGQAAPTEPSSDQRVAAFSAFADFDDVCPPIWHWWGPGPRPRFLDTSGDPLLYRVLPAAQALVQAAGSDQLGQLGSLLSELGGAQK